MELIKYSLESGQKITFGSSPALTIPEWTEPCSENLLPYASLSHQMVTWATDRIASQMTLYVSCLDAVCL